uniref:hypothetical protein n=1 Tax=Flavobacterium sp. TaxID=239 RepID=UPI00404A25AD
MKKQIKNVGYLLMLTGILVDFYASNFIFQNFPAENELSQFKTYNLISIFLLIFGLIIVFVGYNLSFFDPKNQTKKQ